MFEFAALAEVAGARLTVDRNDGFQHPSSHVCQRARSLFGRVPNLLAWLMGFLVAAGLLCWRGIGQAERLTETTLDTEIRSHERLP